MFHPSILPVAFQICEAKKRENDKMSTHDFNNAIDRK